MADDVPITAGTGTPIKTDEVAGKHYQIIKLASGETNATGTVYTDIGSKDHAVRIVPANDIPVGTFIGNVSPNSVFGVSGTFFQATQPVSIASAIGISGSFSANISTPISISGTVSVSPASVFGVTGTFYQAKQPVSLPDAIGISGSFGVTPNSIFGVTGSVSVLGMVQITGSSSPANQPVSPSAVFGVTGTFWQAVQPVSIAAPISVSGTVSVLPAGAFGITGSVSLLGMVQVTGSTNPANQPVSPSAIFGVTGTFFQANQPVTVVNSIGISGTVSVSPASVFGVTGSFYQATQPVSVASAIGISGTVVVETHAVTIPAGFTQITGTVSVTPSSVFGVTGTFFQAKQPVSVPDAISISGSFGVTPNSVFGVTGTFFQTKQPVSVPDAISISGSFGVTPNSVFGVTGTFWQTTQPVALTSPTSISGTVSVNPSSVFGVTGTFYQATQPVSIAALVGISGTVSVSPSSAFGITGTILVSAITAGFMQITGTVTVGTHAVNPISPTSISGTVLVIETPTTSGGCLIFMASNSGGSIALTNTYQMIKNTAGQIYGYYIYNPNSVVTYVHLYNTATGSITVGTTAPKVTLPIPASAAANLSIPPGLAFGTTIAISATATAGGTGSPTTPIDANIWYM
jgi:hypothetical protein